MFRRAARVASGALPSTCYPRDVIPVMLPKDHKGKPKHVYVTGASGSIGTDVISQFRKEGYYVHHVSRWEGYYTELTGAHEHNTWRDLEKNGLADNTAAVVHLAGPSILKPHAGAGFYAANAMSRVEGLELLNSIMYRNPAETVVVASGVNYYPNSAFDADHAFDEKSAPGTSYMSELAQTIELAADQLKDAGVKRVVKMRTGIVVGPALLNRLWWMYKLFAGGTFGDGKQWMPWIEQSDLAHLYSHVVHHEIDGAVNAVSPFPIRNKEFVQAMANAFHRAAPFAYPSILLKAALGSSQADLLLEGPLVEAGVAKATHFHWHHDSIHQCLKEIIPEHAAHRFHEDHGEILY